MSENLSVIEKKLSHLARMRGDVEHSIGKMSGPLATIAQSGVDGLTPDQRETLSAFTTRFASYQEHIGKTMKGLSIEEKSATSPFGAILALMEKLGILDDTEKWEEIREWKEITELRNVVNHEYEIDADELLQILQRMIASAPWLFALHERLQDFVCRTYQRGQ